MARSVLYDVAAAGKFIPDDLKTKALQGANANNISCLLYTSDAADEL